jgi:hypothetical protein
VKVILNLFFKRLKETRIRPIFKINDITIPPSNAIIKGLGSPVLLKTLEEIATRRIAPQKIVLFII